VIGAIVGIGIVGAAWSALAANSRPSRFPTIGEIITAVQNNWVDSAILKYTTFGTGGIFSNLVYTMQNVYMGVLTGLILGYSIGMLMSRQGRIGVALNVPMAIVGSVPVLVLQPFLVFWFGASRLATSGLVIFYTALTVAGAVTLAGNAAWRRFGDYAASLGVKSGRTITQIILPATVPPTWGVLRAATALGWGFQCISEVLGGRAGAGRMLRSFAEATQTPAVIGVLVWVGIIAVVTDAALALVGRWITRWSE
jgi:ABC-type nitrate/sulfonate/bicarbonate transport system permease component